MNGRPSSSRMNEPPPLFLWIPFALPTDAREVAFQEQCEHKLYRLLHEFLFRGKRQKWDTGESATLAVPKALAAMLAKRQPLSDGFDGSRLYQLAVGCISLLSRDVDAYRIHLLIRLKTETDVLLGKIGSEDPSAYGQAEAMLKPVRPQWEDGKLAKSHSPHRAFAVGLLNAGLKNRELFAQMGPHCRAFSKWCERSHGVRVKIPGFYRELAELPQTVDADTWGKWARFWSAARMLFFVKNMAVHPAWSRGQLESYANPKRSWRHTPASRMCDDIRRYMKRQTIGAACADKVR